MLRCLPSSCCCGVLSLRSGCQLAVTVRLLLQLLATAVLVTVLVDSQLLEQAVRGSAGGGSGDGGVSLLYYYRHLLRASEVTTPAPELTNSQLAMTDYSESVPDYYRHLAVSDGTNDDVLVRNVWYFPSRPATGELVSLARALCATVLMGAAGGAAADAALLLAGVARCGRQRRRRAVLAAWLAWHAVVDSVSALMGLAAVCVIGAEARSATAAVAGWQWLIVPALVLYTGVLTGAIYSYLLVLALWRCPLEQDCSNSQDDSATPMVTV